VPGDLGGEDESTKIDGDDESIDLNYYHDTF
jgi:hypothetical protein